MAYANLDHGRPELFDLLTLDESYDRVDWDRVIARLRTHPHEASWFVPGNASTARHGGYGRTDGIDIDDDDVDGSSLVGWTALHTAMYVEPTAEAAEALLEAFPRAARMESSRGDTPLHFVRFTEICPGVVRALLRAAPSVLFVENADGRTPLDELCLWWTHSVEEAGGTAAAVQDEEELDVPIGAGRERDMQWHKIELMLRAAAVVRTASEEEGGNDRHRNYSEEPQSRLSGASGFCGEPSSPRNNGSRRRRPRRRFRPLHVASDLCCPPEVLRYAHSRDVAQIYVRDERTGRAPLSVAAASTVISGKSDGESRSVLEELLALNPAAASATDADGRLPLHLALDSLLTWEGGVESILAAAPRALGTRDVTTHLYPFMAAAVGVAGDACVDINTIYMLLRNGPELASGMADDPPWLRVERKWEAQLQSERKAHEKEMDGLKSQISAFALERDEMEKELTKTRGQARELVDENAALRAELERLKDDMGVLARIGDEMQKEGISLESPIPCHKRRREDTIE